MPSSFFRSGRPKRDYRISATSEKCTAPTLPTATDAPKDFPSTDSIDRTHEEVTVKKSNVSTTIRESVVRTNNEFQETAPSLQIPTVTPETQLLSDFRDPAEHLPLSYSLKLYNYKSKGFEHIYIDPIDKHLNSIETNSKETYTPTLSKHKSKQNKNDILVLTEKNGAMYLPFKLDGTQMDGMIDTGSPVSIISEHLLSNYYPPYRTMKTKGPSPNLSSYTGDPVITLGSYKIPVVLEGFGQINIDFVVTKERFSTLIGRREIQKFCKSIHFLETGQRYVILRNSYIKRSKDKTYVKVIANGISQRHPVTISVINDSFEEGESYIVTCPGSDIVLPSLTGITLVDINESINERIYKVFVKYSS